MYIKFSSEEYIISLKRLYKFEDMCTYLKINLNTFASAVISDFYNRTFSSTFNERELFEKFYKYEYANFEIYLEKMRGIYLPHDFNLQEHVIIVRKYDILNDFDNFIYSRYYDSDWDRGEPSFFELFRVDAEDEDLYEFNLDKYFEIFLDTLSKVDAHED